MLYALDAASKGWKRDVPTAESFYVIGMLRSGVQFLIPVCVNETRIHVALCTIVLHIKINMTRTFKELNNIQQLYTGAWLNQTILTLVHGCMAKSNNINTCMQVHG